MTAFLPHPTREPLSHKFAQFTWENVVELMCNEKQRNRENFNFKSVASAISPHRPCLAKNTQERPLRPKSFFALAEILEASVRPQPPSRERRLCLSCRRQVLKNFASSVADPLGENDMPDFDHSATKFSARNALLLAEMCNAMAGR
jgi:hypothetical protein